MTEQYFEYKDGVCENINCPERKAKLHFKKLFEEKKDDRDNLYEQMQKIRNALEKKNLKENKTDVEWLAKENLKLLDEKTIAEERLKAMEEANKLEQQELEGLKSYREKTENEKKKQVEEYQSLPDKFKDLQKEVDEKVLELQRLEEKELTQLKILNEGKKEIENELNELREIQGKISKEKQNKKDLKKSYRLLVC